MGGATLAAGGAGAASGVPHRLQKRETSGLGVAQAEQYMGNSLKGGDFDIERLRACLPEQECRCKPAIGFATERLRGCFPHLRACVAGALPGTVS
jgi:hypothetical protein